MKRLLISLIILAASVTSAYSEGEKDLAATLAQNSNWAVMSFDGKGLKSESTGLRVFPAQTTTVLFSTVDFFYIDGTGSCRLEEESGIILHNKEYDIYTTRVDNPKNNALNNYQLALPRPFTIVDNVEIKIGENDIDKHTWDSWNLFLSQAGAKEQHLTIYRKWQHKVPSVSLLFTRRDSSDLSSTVKTNSKDTTFIIDDNRFFLDSIVLQKSTDYRERLVKIDSVHIDNAVYKDSSNFHDGFFLCEPISIDTDLDIQDKHSVEVFYSYLDDQLQEQSERLSIKIESKQVPPPHNLGLILSSVLLGLTLIVALLLMLFSPRKKTRKDPIEKVETKLLPANDTGNTVSDAEKQKITRFLESFLESINTIFEESPSVNQTYSDFVAAKVKDFKERIQEKDSRIQELTAQIQTQQGIKSASDNVFGEPEPGTDYESFFQEICNRAAKLERVISDLFGNVPPDQTYAQFLTNEVKDLQDIPTTIGKTIRFPEEGETYVSVIQETSQELKKTHEKLEQCEQDKIDALQKQKEEITSSYDGIIRNLNDRLDAVVNIAMTDRARYLTGILSILSKIQIQYDRFTKRAKTTGKLGNYAKHIAMPLTSYAESLKAIIKNAKEEETVSDIINALRPHLLKGLNDHTSWLNVILRLETYSRAEILRRPMLEDGLDLAALSELYFALQGLMNGVGIELQPLPELFADTTDLSDYTRNKTDIIISDFFEYRDVVQNSAIVDLIKEGYSVTGEEPVKSTITFYPKPQA